MTLVLCVSCEDVISVPDISEDEVLVIAPVDGSVLDEGEITFTWEELEFAEEYQLQIAIPDFMTTNQIVLDTIVGDSIQTFRNFTTTLLPETYEWRIRAFNTEYETEYTARQLEIVTANTPLSDQVITLLAPEDNFETSETAVQFTWETLADASLYRIRIIDPSDNSVFLEETTTNSEVNIDFESGSYTWSVRGENDIQNTAYTTRAITIL